MDTTKQAGPRYRCLDVVAFPAGDGAAFVYAAGSQRRLLLPRDKVLLLDRCQPLRTLPEHAAALAGDGAKVGETLLALRSFRDAGLLLSEEELLGRIANARRPPPPPIAAVGVVTKDRLPSLLRCLGSLLGNTAQAGRREEVVVMDDSIGETARAATLSALGDLCDGARQRGATLRYGGPREKDRYAALLAARAAVPLPVVRFALRDDLALSRACGANHNALLLDQAGQLHLSLDDDVLCQPVRLSDPACDLRLTSTPDPTQFAFFRDAAEARARTREVPLDILGEHERLLGRGLGDLVAAAATQGPIDLQTLSAPFLRALTARARVLVTSLGLCGDSGMGSPAAYLRLRGDSRARLLGSEEDYRAFCRSRQVLRGVSCPTVTDSAFCMAPALGYDAREPLPPFYPVLRNNDGIFGAALRLTLPDGFLGHLPYALRHEPPELREEPPEALYRGAAEVNGFDVILCAMASLRLPARPAGPRLVALGEHLMALSARPLPEFEGELAPLLLRLAGQRAEELSAHLAEHGEAPPYWAADVRRHLETLRSGATAPGYLVPADLRSGRKTKEARLLSQELLRRYGELLCAWEALFEAARALRAEGERPSRPLSELR